MFVAEKVLLLLVISMTAYDNAFLWMPHNLTDDKSLMVLPELMLTEIYIPHNH